MLRLEDGDGRVGFGEIAPLPDFSTEGLKAAVDLLESWGGVYDSGGRTRIPPGFPCTEMALWSAEQFLLEPEAEERVYPVAGLLPSGGGAIERLEQLCDEGFRSFKWKVGVHPREQEFGWLNRLLEGLPPRGRLRLDANAGLDWEDFTAWLDYLEGVPQIEYFEEPVGPEDRPRLQETARTRGIQVALDESVSQVDSLLKALLSGWTGLLVIKPGIIGSPLQYVQWQAGWERDFVFSSVFETSVGLENALRLIGGISDPERVRPLGFGTRHFFPADGLNLHSGGPQLQAGVVGIEAMEEIWKDL